MAPEVETHLVNAVLTNGARYYVDHAHPELSTPECADARVGRGVRPGGRADPAAGRWPAARRLLPDGPGDRRLQEQLRRQGQLATAATRTTSWTGRCRSAASSPTPRRTSSPARSSPAPARSAREAPGIARRRRAVPAHPAGRLLRGGGRPRDHAEAADHQHPRRAARRRPEVPAPPRHRRRRQPVARSPPSSRSAPPRSCWPWSRTTPCRATFVFAQPGAGHAPGRPTTSRSARPLELADGTTITALEVQWELLDRARKYAERARARGGRRARSAPRCCDAGRRCSPGSRPTRCRWPTSVDWVAKYRLHRRLPRAPRPRSGTTPAWPRMDLQYHDLRPEQVAGRAGSGCERIVDRRRGRARP